MPVPATIDDLSPTAGSNSPAGGETPKDGDNYIRALSGFIAELRDKLDGTSNTGTITNATFVGTAEGLRVPVVAYKTATTSRASTTTFADDPHLVLALTSGTWMFECFTPIWASTSGAGGFKVWFTYSGTTTSSDWVCHGLLSTTWNFSVPKTVNADTFIVSSINTAAGMPGSEWLRYSGVITTTTSGNFALQWAQNSSNANSANIGQGAWLVCTKLA